MFKTITLATALATFGIIGAASAETLKLGNVAELSGPGATVGNAWTDAINMGVDEINAAGGVLGMQLEIDTYDTQTDAQTSRALVQKAIDDGAFLILGTVYSSSTIVNMLVTMQQGIPQIVGSESPSITQKGNPYVFRSSFGAQKSMPKIAAYLDEGLGAKSVAVSWVNNEFGKGGHDAFVAEMEARGIEVVADVSSEVGQADFASDVTQLKSANADAIFVYLHEEESARLLKELRKQNVEAPIIGETTLLNQKVIELSEGAADGIMGHVGLTVDAPNPEIQAFAKRFSDRYGYKADHNAMKGYVAIYTAATAIERAGELDRQKVADTLHNMTITVEDVPNILLNVSWDETGEVSRESFLVEVQGDETIVKDMLPAN
ncbi:ABC transporter substrate-binding protein [Pseudooceanicola sp. 216_PA32_1]|uniref:ABC transporter substrate-binding protein n=1 Tax=Pseudooceanicola pacificus TaxID=2676438 RepID=A0A844WB88_9RHOB|nr:ABC transporter substrate-binding protein [Pseudooceanicola pacificus]MWB78038.1 ABC transporter substrate-binding protein [Pseudooceanicola pacificus]